MLFYRQITVLVLFFIILFLFLVPGQKNIFFILLKGLALGGLILVFFAYANPSLLKSKRSKDKKDNKKLFSTDYNQYSSVIKDSYNQLITNSEEIITTMSNDLSVGIYIHDDNNGDYTIQNKITKNFIDVIDSNNKIISNLIDKKKTQIIKKQNDHSAWKELLIEKTWRGSEAIIAVPIIYKDFPIGFIFVFTDHFSNIDPQYQLVFEKVSQIITLGMRELEEFEKLIIANNFNSKLTKLI